ncbi:unnamed protein product [Aphanomyces euteiches]|uniref:Single-strand DNA deaminase toxin A-like C-terminal domain-containing protein n=1 Tax=Aphanomyces euteiches TaxID=100861 RepID=A0A6G0XT77_9STRA|nr:hypothetical protein Ae201684_001732 [Aphanomyces euteiches]KAH9075488.1 hypothetical protein Ae201684P_004167 [Aphanomyces euteiches]KAH9151909.1 hypothetical protein AeRB84_005584 [Aphanomyces euteiches]
MAANESSNAMAAATSYYTFSAFLGEDQSRVYLSLPHREQIQLFQAYLTFLQTERVQFPTSKRATTCYAAVSDASESTPELEQVVAGVTLSGFGVCGTDSAYLPQCDLSIGAAWLADAIGHQYVVENATVLNSRSFMFGWCHAEKQKLTDLHRKINDKAAWQAIRLVVDRDMCRDCIAFATAMAKHEDHVIKIQDPKCTRLFCPDDSVREIDDGHPPKGR